MKHLFFPIAFIALMFSSCKEANQKTEKEKARPNIIFFLADDLGYGELGVYGQEKINTPNIDQLAKNGMRFTQFYSGAPVCAPARSILLTGLHSGHTPIRGNDEWAERGAVWDYEKAANDPSLEGQRPIPDATLTLGEVLQSAGYTTSVFGKWGLGAPHTEGVPNKQGFDYFYGYNCQRQAHNLYPPHLWENDTKVALENPVVKPNTPLDPEADPNNEESYAIYNQKDYAPEKIHQKAIQFIEKHKDSAFFMYYASPLPHLPLQAPDALTREYLEKFGAEEPYTGGAYFPNRYPRATYAAMIGYLDQQLGDLVKKLKDEGIYENTIIIFSSDNGPTYLGGVDAEYFNSARPFSNAYGRTKGFVYEGGIRVPLIASWPKHIKEGAVSDHQGVFYDVMPTLCDLIGAESPSEIDGLSFANTLLGKPEQAAHDFLYWEFPEYNGQQAVRTGNWKGVRKNIRDGNLTIELYNLENDPRESNDLSNEHPEIVETIRTIMEREHVASATPKFKLAALGDE